MRIVFILICSIFWALSAKAYYIEAIVVDEDYKEKKLPEYRKNPKDSSEAIKELKSLISTLHDQTYIAARIDTLFFTKDSVKAFIYIGQKYKWVSLRKGNVDGYLLDRTGFRERFYRNTPFRYKEYNKLEATFIKLSENNGFPFASIRLDSIELTERGISAAINYQKGPQFVFDSINIIGKTKTKKRYLMRHLRIFKGQPYSQQRVDDAEKLLKSLSFVTQKRPPQLVLSKNKAVLHVFLEDRKNNQIDGIVGFLPSQGTNKKLLVTGELNLGLRNLFGTGKILTINWKKVQVASQTLDMNYQHPKFLGSSLDAAVSFNLYKQDSSFLTVNRQVVFTHRAGTTGKVNILGGLKTSRPLEGLTDTSAQKLASINNYTYGLGYDRNNLDNRNYPRRGWLFSTLGYIGDKTIIPNSSFPPSYYAGTRLKSFQFNLEGVVEKYTKVGKGGVFLTRMAAGKVFNNKDNLFFNDLYRVGGLKTLRGFNQNYFYATMYSVATLEYRFFTDESSYLMLFYDQGYLINVLSTVSQYDHPSGFGAGVSFSTAGGVFSFVYALGNSNEQKVSLSNSKISFGITSNF
ncbi:MAG TPA: POTRA domain-containing protein [Cytophagaceae bacterium]|nr:POTRA domain-containing protein [Cytophagaceae bacterium]